MPIYTKTETTDYTSNIQTYLPCLSTVRINRQLCLCLSPTVYPLNSFLHRLYSFLVWLGYVTPPTVIIQLPIAASSNRTFSLCHTTVNSSYV